MVEANHKKENESMAGSRNVQAGRDISGQVNTGDITNSDIDAGHKESRIISTNIINEISISNEYLDKMPPMYAESLKKFSNIINNQLQTEQHISPETILSLQESVNDVAKEMVDVKQGEQQQQQIKFEKKSRIRTKLEAMAVRLVRMSPKIAKTVVGLTPLAPFKDLVREAFEGMVKAILDEQSSTS